MLGDWASHADLYGEHAIGLMVRRQRTELVETIERSRALYAPLGWEFKEQEKMWRSPNGARLRFAYLERDQDAEAYQGHSYSRVYVEEVGNFPSPKPILKLLATLRSGAGVPCGMRLTGNPGGPGHQWVKARYIDPAPMGYEVLTDEASGLQRVFIPSKIRDNKFLGEDYVQRLRAVGSEQLVRAWLEGDWSVIDGAFFDGWSNERHVIKPFTIPSDWLRFRSMDWGFARPFSVGWWAVVGDNTTLCPASEQIRLGDATRIAVSGLDRHAVLPRGSLIRYREWYGASAPNVGLRLTAEDVARGIAAREANEKITYGVIDPAAFAQDGGPSIAERMAKCGVHFRRADNTRVGPRGALGGWDQMRARLKGDVDGKPMLYVFETCRDFIRTVPALQHDPDRPEDLDTDGEDHAADEARYGCLSRPWVPKPVEQKKPTELQFEVKPNGAVVSNMSIREIVEAKARKRRLGL